MNKTQRKQAIQQLYIESCSDNEQIYLLAISSYLNRFVDDGVQMTDSATITDTNIWGYSEAANRVRVKAKELGIWV